MTTIELVPAEVQELNRKIATLEKPGQISDWFHSFDELYDHRIALFIALCRHYQSSMSMQLGEPQSVCFKSEKHSDGTAWEGWFIMQLNTTAGQISYHLPMKFWDDCDMAETLEVAHEWDGHTPSQVVERLLQI